MTIYRNLSAILACGLAGELGLNGELLWRHEADLMSFKQLTTNTTLIMGRKTFDTLPKTVYLTHGRSAYVLSSNKKYDKSSVFVRFNSVEEVLAVVGSNPSHKFMVIGGGQVYTQMIDCCQTVHLTQMQATFPQADTFFDLRQLHQFVHVEHTGVLKDSKTKLKASFLTLTR